MGQKTSKKCRHPTKGPHMASQKKRQAGEFNNDTKNMDTNIFKKEKYEQQVIFNECKQEININVQVEQNLKRRNDVNYENGSLFLRNNQNGNNKEFISSKEIDFFFQAPDFHNHNRIRRFRDKIAHHLRSSDVQCVLETFLKKEIFNQKEYFEIKSQLNTKWMCWRLCYVLEQKIKNDDLTKKTTVFTEFLECLRSPQIHRNKLAGNLAQENGEPCPSWCSDGNDEGILDFAEGLVLTPSLLEEVLCHVYCSSDQLSWWRWIPYKLGLQQFTNAPADPESPEYTCQSQHSKLKNALYQWGATEGFARGGLEVLLICLRNHVDACEVDWRGLKKLLKSKHLSSI